jgi:serine protease Do
MKERRRSLRRFFLSKPKLSVVVCATLLASGQAWAGPKDNPPLKLSVDDSPLNPQVKAATSFAPVVKKAAPSVVNIYSTMMVREHQLPLFDFSDPFRQFFGGDKPSSRQRLRREESLGSGVIVSPDGYILTANHVVEGAESVKVALSTGEKEFDAKIIGTDPPTDVAVLKIDADKPLPAITAADSDKLEVGDRVLAVGNPFAVGQTVTAGIISALGRGGFGLNGASGYEDFIQTDAAINPGNSGGALVDAEGRLIGINTAILTHSGGYQGVGFAVPINMARSVLENLIEHGKVTRGFLGVHIQQLTPTLAGKFGLPDESSGVLVDGVDPDSAAQKAGLRDGDVIVEVNGKKVVDPRSLQLLVTQTPPHTKVTLQVLRSEVGQKPIEKILTANLGELPEAAMRGDGERAPGGHGQSKMDSLDGVGVDDLDAKIRGQLDIPASVHGALVTSVDPDSNSAQAGLREGDVILEIDRHPVHNAEDAVALSGQAKGENVLLRVWSSGDNGGPAGTRYLTVDNRKHK